MEPGINTPQLNGEQAPSGGYSPEISTEYGQISNVEQLPEAQERESQPQDATPVAVDVSSIVSPSLPRPVSEDVSIQQQATVVDSGLAATDDDRIESAWVDKAKQIIVSTSGDPYRREDEVGKLRDEYRNKRYGGGGEGL